MKEIVFGLCLALLAVFVALAAQPGYSSSVTPGLIARYVGYFGQGAKTRLQGWHEFVRRSAAERRDPGEMALLAPVNGFFNRLPSMTDQELWGVVDYWATPAEFLSVNGGDCEDYAIAKYFTLKELGIPVVRLRLVYARSRLSAEAHLVLAYYAAPDADPLILDNLEGGIKPATDRPDLTPVYTFNDEDLQVPQRNAPSIRLSATSNRKWQSVLEKLQRELAY